MKAKTMDVIFWSFLVALITAALIGVMYITFNRDDLHVSPFVVIGFVAIALIVCAVKLGYAIGAPSVDPVERREEAERYAYKILSEEENKKHAKRNGKPIPGGEYP